MRYIRAAFLYSCSKGHANEIDLYFSSKSGVVDPEDIKRRLPQFLSCDICPKGSLIEGTIKLELLLHWLTPQQFAALDVHAESIDPILM